MIWTCHPISAPSAATRRCLLSVALTCFGNSRAQLKREALVGGSRGLTTTPQLMAQMEIIKLQMTVKRAGSSFTV